jgi:nitroreductase
MKSLLSAFLLLACTGLLVAQDIELPAARKTGGMPLMEVLAKRSTARAFDSRDLTNQQLSDLLWAGFGINRPDGKRTAPSSHNGQEIALYIVLKQGTFVYDAQKNLLHQIVAEDLRNLACKVAAPMVLLFVADLSKRGETGENRKNVASVDSGFISQNIYLYCASEGLATGYRGSFDRAALLPKLNLKPDLEIIAVQPVGYPKP